MIELTVRRQARGWSKSELARRSRITPSDVGRIESLRMVPYPSQLKKLARVFGLTVTDAPRLLDEVSTTAEVASPPQSSGVPSR